jgi:hypothetical protein
MAQHVPSRAILLGALPTLRAEVVHQGYVTLSMAAVAVLHALFQEIPHPIDGLRTLPTLA